MFGQSPVFHVSPSDHVTTPVSKVKGEGGGEESSNPPSQEIALSYIWQLKF